MNIGIAFSASSSFPYWYILWGVGGALVLAGLIALIVALRKGKKPAPAKLAAKSEYIAALGGEENIVSHLRKGSRIELKLKDYAKIDREKLKEAGVASFLLMSDRLTLVIKGNAEQVENVIFGA